MPQEHKLLSEQELQKKCLTVVALQEFGTTPSNLSGEQLGRIAFASVDLYQFIQSQKIAHARHVIGENVVPLMPGAPGTKEQWDAYHQDKGKMILQGEQLERNK